MILIYNIEELNGLNLILIYDFFSTKTYKTSVDINYSSFSNTNNNKTLK